MIHSIDSPEWGLYPDDLFSDDDVYPPVDLSVPASHWRDSPKPSRAAAFCDLTGKLATTAMVGLGVVMVLGGVVGVLRVVGVIR